MQFIRLRINFSTSRAILCIIYIKRVSTLIYVISIEHIMTYYMAHETYSQFFNCLHLGINIQCYPFGICHMIDSNLCLDRPYLQLVGYNDCISHLSIDHAIFGQPKELLMDGIEDILDNNLNLDRVYSSFDVCILYSSLLSNYL